MFLKLKKGQKLGWVKFQISLTKVNHFWWSHFFARQCTSNNNFRKNQAKCAKFWIFQTSQEVSESYCISQQRNIGPLIGQLSLSFTHLCSYVWFQRFPCCSFLYWAHRAVHIIWNNKSNLLKSNKIAIIYCNVRLCIDQLLLHRIVV